MEKYTQNHLNCLLPIEEKNDFILPRDLNAIFVFGRGILKRRDQWEPTDSVGYGEGSFMKHDGKYHRNISPNSKMAIIKGGKYNVIATFEILKRLRRDNQNLPVVAFAAGSPDYITDPFVSEGNTMNRMLLELFIKNKFSFKGLKTRVLDKAQSSIDDVKNSLEFATISGHRNIAFLSVESHLPRLRQMAQKTLYDNPKLVHGGIREINFISSWKVLESINRKNAKKIAVLRTSKAEKKFMDLEKDAIKNLRTKGLTHTVGSKKLK